MRNKNSKGRNNKTDNTAIRGYKPKAREYEDTCNDPSWYYLTKQQLEDNASWNFASVLGQSFSTQDGHMESVPGLATLYLQPTIGAAESVEALPVNEAGQAIWTWLRSNQKIKQDFDQQDYMAYLIACAQALSAYVALRKVLGCAYLYSAQNKYLPTALIQSMGIDPKSVIGNMAKSRDELNTLALNMNTIAVPAGMPYFSRQIFLYDNIYKDEDIVKAPMYHYAPSYFLQYDDKGTAEYPGSMLKRVYVNRNQPITFSEAIRTVTGMVDAIRNSTDGTNMSATTLNAFPDSQLIRAGVINGDYKANIVYNEEVLMQIENARVAGEICNGQIVQDPNTNLFGYLDDTNTGIAGLKSILTTASNSKVSNRPLVKFHKNSVSCEEIVVATRLTPNVVPTEYSTKQSKWHAHVKSCGTEIVEDIGFTFFIGNEWQMVTIYTEDICTIPATNPEGVTATLTYLTKYGKFRCAPTLYLNSGAPDRNQDVALGTFTDLGNYVVPSEDQLDGVNTMACRAEFWMNDLITMQA